MPCTEPELLTPAAVATILSLKAGTLAVWRRKNQGPPWLHIGSRVFYPARELHRWLHAQPHGGEPAQVAPEISATVLAANAKINRSRLSNIERGYIQPTEEELQRLKTALEDLIKAESVVDRVAASLGWPCSLSKTAFDAKVQELGCRPGLREGGAVRARTGIRPPGSKEPTANEKVTASDGKS